MAGQSYTIRLNLTGNTVQQLTAIEQRLNRINASTVKLNGYGGMWSTSSTVPIATATARAATAHAAAIPNNRFYGIGRQFGKDLQNFRNQFLRNSFSLRGWTVNVQNFTKALGGLNTALGRAVPLLGNVTNGIKYGILGAIGTTALSGVAYSAATKLLNSNAIGQAASDRLQFEAAERGLGPSYGRALRDATAISAQYGIPRASAVSNLNVLSGFSTEKGDIPYTQATNLTRAAALISSFSSRPFDLVALNLQQILGVSSPNQRDIRELLHQAPILSKYALQDYREQGIKGGDPREYYKDRDRLLMQLDRLVREFQVPRTSEIRGQMELRRRDFFIDAERKLTPIWETIGDANARLYGVLGPGLGDLARNINIKHLDELLTTFAVGLEDIVKIIPSLISTLNEVVQVFNFAPRTIKGVAGLLRGDTRLANQGFFATQDYMAEGLLERDFYTGLTGLFRNQILSGGLTEDQLKKVGDIDNVALNLAREIGSQITDSTTFGEARAFLRRQTDEDGLELTGSGVRIPTFSYKGVPYKDRINARYTSIYDATNSPLEDSPVAHIYDISRALELFTERLDEILGTSYGPGGVGADLKDIEDLTKGSKQLIVNFNAPLVQIPTEVYTGTTVDDVLDSLANTGQLENAITHGLNIALNNSTRSHF